MKLQYQLLTKPDPCYKELADLWSNSKENLQQVMEMLYFEDNGLKYEVILQLSLFLLMPNRSERILSIMRNNKDILVDDLQSFQLDKPDEDFTTLKTKMLQKI